jgi:hypothetical protein
MPMLLSDCRGRTSYRARSPSTRAAGSPEVNLRHSLDQFGSGRGEEYAQTCTARWIVAESREQKHAGRRGWIVARGGGKGPVRSR